MFSKIILPISLCLAALPGSSQTAIRKIFDPMPDAKLASIPNFVLDAKYKDRTAHPLPKSVDNSKSKFFPPYWEWSIEGWACSNATATTYCYGYEVQYLKSMLTVGKDPMFPYEYTYHFLNHGDQNSGGDGWNFVEAFDILKETGAPTTADFGGFETGNATQTWMSGYDKYFTAMKVRASEYYKIDASLASSDELIKQYLYDHGDGSSAGGVLTFQVNSENWKNTGSGGGGGGPYNDPIPTFTMLGDGGGHALTIVGYDDAIAGGSYLVVNNWGDGEYWVPYALLRAGQPLATAQGVPVMFCRIKKDYSPKFALKISITHNSRGSICIMTGVANSANAAAPTKTKDYAGAFNFAGGAFPMNGKGGNGTLEIGLDLTDFVPEMKGPDSRFFLQIISKGGAGTVNSVSLMDYTGATVKEVHATETNKAIGVGTTLISIPWSGNAAGIGQDSRAPASHAPAQGISAFASPNPARRSNGRMYITYANPANASAVLNITDVSGKPVYHRAINGEAGSPASASGGTDVSSGAFASANAGNVGMPVIAWDMTNSQGALVAPGFYFASIAMKDPQGKTKTVTTKLKVVD